ncbi:RNA methyltransferase [Candidatus Parcubacteria bacterium]|nr:RNA methyltransferase [Candidatus Parcubacteria bacterium]
MLEINSKDNEKIKLLRKLQQKKYRDKFSSFLVENLVIIKDSIKAGFIFEELYLTDEFIKKHEKDFEYLVNKSKGNYYIIKKTINKDISKLDTPSGIIAKYKKPRKKNLFSRGEDEKQVDTKKVIVYLNGINDPGNLGTIFRTGLAFGIKNFVVDEKCADVYNTKTIQAAKDSIFKLNINQDKNLKKFKEIKKEMPVYSTCLEDGDEIKKYKTKENFCLVFGNESHGVDKEILDLSDGFVKIKINKDIESLNVAISTGIIFYCFYGMNLK